MIALKRLYRLVLLIFISVSTLFSQKENNIFKSDIFPFQPQHVHGSTLVELPNNDILVAWFQGSGERQSDDVAIMGARFLNQSQSWSSPFELADVPDFPDINPVLFLDTKDRLWLVWYTVLANQWETSLLKYRISTDYQQPSGAPVWQWQDMIHIKPGGKTERGIQEEDPFLIAVQEKFEEYDTYVQKIIKLAPEGQKKMMQTRWQERQEELLSLASGSDMVARGKKMDTSGNLVNAQLGYPRFRRMGWQTRNKPLFLSSGKMLLPLYSDGFDFSLIAITDDLGNHWSFSEPIVSIGGVQPALIQRQDGTIIAYMRDNGPPPNRLMYSTSTDEGIHWSMVEDEALPNPGSAADVVKLKNGDWLLIHNDTEDQRYSLALSMSKDEGKSWTLIQHLERDLTENTKVRAHYPAIIQGKDGKIHLSYSYQRSNKKGEIEKTIRYVQLSLD